MLVVSQRDIYCINSPSWWFLSLGYRDSPTMIPSFLLKGPLSSSGVFVEFILLSYRLPHIPQSQSAI